VAHARQDTLLLVDPGSHVRDRVAVAEMTSVNDRDHAGSVSGKPQGFARASCGERELVPDGSRAPSLGHIAQAQTVAETVVIALEDRADALSSPEALSLCGALHLVLAVAAARDSDREAANDYLATARSIAARIGEDRNDYGTEFGPANVALHSVGVAVELGDAGHALDLARTIDSSHLSAERQSPYLIDLAPGTRDATPDRGSAGMPGASRATGE
jgi:hypothetical protein